jgi:hypothetical protein
MSTKSFKSSGINSIKNKQSSFNAKVLTDFKVQRSLRFRRDVSASLTRTMGTSWTDKKKWTLSFWFKKTRNDESSGLGLVYYNSGGSGGNLTFSGSGGGGSTVNDDLIINNRNATTGTSDYYIRCIGLFRDPSVWNHLVVNFDSTHAATTERVRFYLNGKRITDFGAEAIWPTQNYESSALFGGSSVIHQIGNAQPSGAIGYYDGYMSEFYFIDGQAISPGAFAKKDLETLKWVPIRYSGTFGSNGFYLPFSDNETVTNIGRDYAGGYNLCGYSEDFTGWPTKIGMSVTADNTTAPNGTNTADRITSTTANGQAYIRYDSSSVPASTYWTMSCYVKAGNTNIVTLSDGFGTGAWAKFDLSTGSLVSMYNPYGYQEASINENINGWYVIRNSFITNNAASYPVGIRLDIGRGYGDSGPAGEYLWAWGAQINMGKTRDLYTANNTGSSINKNWTASNISLTSGISYDSMVDTPSTFGLDNGLGGEFRGNYCTLNNLFTQYTRFTDATVINGTTISNGGLKVSSTGSVNIIPGTIGVQSGKWYFEYKPTTVSSGADMIGWSREAVNKMNGYRSSGIVYNDGAAQSGFATWTSSDTIGCAFDADNRLVSFYKNGSLVTTITMTATINEFYYPILWLRDTCSGDVNFGQRPFSYPAPSGYKTLCTENLPEPIVRNPKQYFTPRLFSGEGALSQKISTGFQTDLTIIKARNQDYSPALHDSVLPNRPILFTDSSAIESAGGSYISSFNSDGFTVNNNTIINGSGNTYASWSWNKSPSAGLDIVSYSGNNSSGRAISHNLGRAPKMILVKSRNSVSDWAVWHTGLSSATHDIRLNVNDTQTQGYQFGTLPTSSVFYVGGSGSRTNSTGTDYVAYVFSEIDGLSKFGEYQGTGVASNQPFIYTNFSPAMVLIKNISSGAHWIVFDNHRDLDNIAGRRVALNLTDLENKDDANLGTNTQVGIDMLSNGFKIRATGPNHSAASNSYIYAAFADVPFKYAMGR